ncbi:hypothetical protein MUCCIDRAFT_159340 [Mucor lusitanicus CBS 277.49]|uniref:Uncharacterized protein n=1 Tax=Mucor lusitanicus CBS 277.49 TaxID=747725 RepID=A0A168QFY7_MUCCL|nr:hypothetical protein MUCCIDRAFT_159340 [Mucor lusitanicus CBS 277.49]
MNYQDGSRVQFGDIVTIGSIKDNKLITVEKDGETLVLHEFIAPEKHALLVCGNSNTEPGQFYLTFKYNRGFLYGDPDQGILKSGVPWFERTAFDVDKLKSAVFGSGGSLKEGIVVTKVADAEKH